MKARQVGMMVVVGVVCLTGRAMAQQQPLYSQYMLDAFLVNPAVAGAEGVTAINHTTKSQRLDWQKQPVSQWVIDSYQIAQQLYSEIREPDQKLSYRYNFDHVQTLNDQLLKGGVHLAGLLNEIFG